MIALKNKLQRIVQSFFHFLYLCGGNINTDSLFRVSQRVKRVQRFTLFLFDQCEKKKTKNICREGINTFLLSLAIFPKHITFVPVIET